MLQCPYQACPYQACHSNNRTNTIDMQTFNSYNELATANGGVTPVNVRMDVVTNNAIDPVDAKKVSEMLTALETSATRAERQQILARLEAIQEKYKAKYRNGGDADDENMVLQISEGIDKILYKDGNFVV